MRVVVTGMSAFTPIGNGLAEFAAGLREGRDGIKVITRFDATRHRVQRAAEVVWEKPEGSSYSRATEMALAAAREALRDASTSRDALAAVRTGVILSSNQAGMPPTATRYAELSAPYRLNAPYRRGSSNAETKLRILDGAPTATLDLLMMEIGGSTLSMNISTACSAGLHAIGMAFDAIRSGQADVIVVVATEVLTEPALAGFSVLRALTTAEGPRPFSAQRDGTLLGEGAAAIVIESAERATRRGACVWGEIAGYGSSTDAYHMTRPQSEGAVRAMRDALGDHALDDVDWVKAHGTGTPSNDVAEASAIQQLFARSIPVTSIKATLGHSLGASGVVEAIGALLSMHGGFIPPTLRVDEVDPACAIDVVTGRARAHRGAAVMANAFGFGGNNAAILLRREGEM